MEATQAQQKKEDENTIRKGGLRTMPFIIGNEVFEKVSSAGLLANMIIYLIKEYHMSAAAAASVMFISGALSSFAPVVGAYLSDAYLGRYRTIAVGSVASFAGISLLWFTALLPRAKPLACGTSTQNCPAANGSQLALLYSALLFLGIGSGGIRPCSIPFGADQFSHKKNPEKQKILDSYFNWYYSTVGIAYLLAVTVIVYIQDKLGWKIGFSLAMMVMFFATTFFFIGSPLYIKVKSQSSALTGLAYALIAAVKNRHIKLPAENEHAKYHYSKDSKPLKPSQKLRLLNKACIVENPAKDLQIDGTSVNPWNLCTVEQVENLKLVLRVLPIWSTGIVFCLVQNQTFFVLQASSMNRYIWKSFQIPAGSFGVFQLIAFSLTTASYSHCIIPLLRIFTRNPNGITLKQRMGIGLVFTALSTTVAAAVEHHRRVTEIKQGLLHNADGIFHMSALWLVPQQIILGIAEAFFVIGQIEFFYSGLPKTMASFAVGLHSLASAVANLIGTLIVKLVVMITIRSDGESWLSNDLNKGHYDYYYWLLTVIVVFNLCYFILCSWLYGEDAKSRDLELENGLDLESNVASKELHAFR